MQFKHVSELTKEQIEELKQMHGRIFRLNVCDTDYIIKPLYASEWDRVKDMASSTPEMQMAEIDDKIVELCLIGPRPDITKGGWATVPAGVVPTLARFVSAKSGFIVPEIPEVTGIELEPLYERGPAERPTDEDIDALKSMTNLTLVGMVIDGDYFVVRPITRQEWRSITKSNAAEDDERDLQVSTRTVLWPKKVNWDALPAGYPTTIAQYVMEISGYAGPSSVEEL